jgi:hypothetical protein
MRRLLTFALLGPPLGFITVLVVGGLISDRSAVGMSATAWLFSIVLMPFAYLVGIGPALVAWIVDELLSRVLRLEFRMITSAIAGYAAVALFKYFLAKYPTTREILEFGIIGAIPAVACTWISDKIQKPASRQS